MALKDNITVPVFSIFTLEGSVRFQVQIPLLTFFKLANFLSDKELLIKKTMKDYQKKNQCSLFRVCL